METEGSHKSISAPEGMERAAIGEHIVGSSEKINRVQLNADLEDLVPDLLAEIDENLSSMEKNLNERDFETIHRLGHGLKGAAGSYELPELADIFLAVELTAKERDPDGVFENLACVKNYLARLEIEYVEKK